MPASQAFSAGCAAVPRSRPSRAAVVSASGEITNRLAARVSALTCHQPMVMLNMSVGAMQIGGFAVGGV